MQVATNAKRHGVQPRARHSILASAFPVFCHTSPVPSQYPSIAAKPHDISVDAEPVSASAGCCWREILNLHGGARITALQPVAVPKRSDRWKNMRNSSLSIA